MELPTVTDRRPIRTHGAMKLGDVSYFANLPIRLPGFGRHHCCRSHVVDTAPPPGFRKLWRPDRLLQLGENAHTSSSSPNGALPTPIRRSSVARPPPQLCLQPRLCKKSCADEVY
jgi:hypothetical protein